MNKSYIPIIAIVWAAFVSCGGAGSASPPGAPSSVTDGAPPPPRSGPPYAGGAPIQGTVGPRGGAVSRLYFAIVGDTRPVEPDDTSGYPVGVVSKIYETMAAVIPRPTFAISTGDYQYTSANGGQGGPQIDLYVRARSRYPGVLFPAMGNHECTGLTSSNCGAGNVDGTPAAYRAYLSGLLAPIGQTSPYFEFDVNSTDGKWTSKFLVVAANAWSAAQDAWLSQAMSRPTTYTFVVRHEGSNATTAPGVTPSERILAAHPYTLLVCGHTHTYAHPARRELIVGNGGAPLSSSARGYGFAVVSQQADGSMAVDMVDYVSGQADPDFHFVLNADGN